MGRDATRSGINATMNEQTPGTTRLADRRADRPRMVDVARRAGVSPVTVSRFLRQPERVRAETRQRIAAAIAELNYLPDLIAGSLASNRSRIVATVVPTLSAAFFADTVQGLADVLHGAGYALLFGNSGYRPEEEERLVAAFLGRRADAVVLSGSQHTKATRAMLADAAVPVVEVWELVDRPLDMAVGFSNERAASEIARTLLARGCRRVVLLSAPAGRERRSDQRRAGFRRAMAEAGLSADRDLGVEEPSHARSGAAALPAILRRWPDADAVFCANDNLAAGLIAECHRRGVAVPGRLAVAGFGDFDIAAATYPSLTTVRVPSYAIGRQAACLVLDRLAGAPPPAQAIDLGFEVVRRESA